MRTKFITTHASGSGISSLFFFFFIRVISQDWSFYLGVQIVQPFLGDVSLVGELLESGRERVVLRLEAVRLRVLNADAVLNLLDLFLDGHFLREHDLDLFGNHLEFGIGVDASHALEEKKKWDKDEDEDSVTVVDHDGFLTPSCPLGRIVGGTMSGVRAAGGSLPACFRCISHMAKANCSGFNFPSCFMSHRFLQRWDKMRYHEIYLRLSLNFCYGFPLTICVQEYFGAVRSGGRRSLFLSRIRIRLCHSPSAGRGRCISTSPQRSLPRARPRSSGWGLPRQAVKKRRKCKIRISERCYSIRFIPWVFR